MSPLDIVTGRQENNKPNLSRCYGGRMDVIPQLLVNGVIAGGTYALAAIGYTMVYGILKFINFAHGSVAMTGAYIVFVLTLSALNVPFVVAFFLSMVLTAIIGILIEKSAYKPLRNAPKLAPLTTAIAVSFVLDAAVMILVGTDIKTYSVKYDILTIGSVFITSVQVIIIFASLFFMVCLYALLTYTKLGKAIRAVADNINLAEIAGINTDMTISAVFAIGSALAAASGSFDRSGQQLAADDGLHHHRQGVCRCRSGRAGQRLRRNCGGRLSLASWRT